MKRGIKTTLIIILAFAVTPLFAQKKIKIACVGNSITYGAGIADREHNSYPAQLQNMLGDGYDVKNFGHNGATLLKGGANPYWDCKEYKEALAFNPDIVFIKLGTNDSKAVNRPHYNRFVTEYKALIASFQNGATKPRIVLLQPVASFMTDTSQIWNDVIVKQIAPMIQQAAYETKLETINFYPYFAERPDLFPDQIHPTSQGAAIIAKRLYELVKATTDKNYNSFSLIKKEKKISSFYGFDCIDFKYAGRNCKLVKPRAAAKGHPWVWRARFWGHEPQTDISLLERGFHVAYCDVAELFGNKEAVNSWNQFYALMQQCGLSKKAVLEGMSRGGIYVYNWALANPGRVACIYADAPVLNLVSWPGNKRNAGAEEPWANFKKDYHLTEAQALRFKNNPLDHATKIAKLGFPMLHVVGDADDVVPVAENTAPFEQKITAAGGSIMVIHKPGVNHHPHSLKDPTPITGFILRATGYDRF
ncbi:GDSL-type esterase/lipase family protein [Niabella hirudinis]|uniref:GDSL-type esterase/lipase family protein n=1 Tax=Niabella hirudinis TaxID=1285929 RepID=UPI003EBB22BD